MGIYEDPKDGPTVIHFPVPLKAPGVKVLDTWRTLGMRGTGSHDIALEGRVHPGGGDAGVRRPAGKWHPFMHAVVACSRCRSSTRPTSASPRRPASWPSRAREETQDRSSARLPGRRDGEPAGHRAGRSTRAWSSWRATAKPGPETTGRDADPPQASSATPRSAPSRRRWRSRAARRFYRATDARAPVPRRAGGPLPPAAGESADALHRARPAGPRHRRLTGGARGATSQA